MPKPAALREHCNAEERRALIEKLAYARAQERGFVPGHELADWLAAEAEAEQILEGELFGGG
jgi:hypothetical protein